MKQLILAISIMCTAATLVLSREQVIVTLRSERIPEQLRSMSARPLIPERVVSSKKQDDLLSLDQRQAWMSIQRYVVVDVANDQERARLLLDPDVEAVASIRRVSLHDAGVTNDSLSEQQWALPLVGAPAAWKTATADGVRVGVLDTGIDWNHPDLVRQLSVNASEDVNDNGTFEPWPSSQEIDGVSGDLDGVDNDGNGYTDDVIGFDFVDQSVRNLGDDRDRDPIPGDEQGHGTSVAGVIAAEANNNIGIAGLAYDARIVTLRAFDATGNAEEDDIAAALIYAALNGVRVVNMSFGDGVDSPVMKDAVRFAAAYGCVLVASAGNSGAVSRQYPAGYDEVMAVASTNRADLRSPFSSTGSIVDLSAPGEQIVTTAVDGRYRTVSGTSFAAPMVAATAAMMLEVDPTLTASEIRTILGESSQDLGDKGWDTYFGNGRLQSDRAVEFVGKGRVEIVSPYNESEVDVRTTASIAVVGSVIATLFDHYEVFVGRGAEPVSWSSIGDSSSIVSNDTLALIDSGAVVEGDNVVRLLVSLKDGRTLEHRKRIRVVKKTQLTITSFEAIPAWLDDRKAAVVTVTTSRPTQVRIHRTTSNGITDSTTDIQRFTRTHSVVLPSPDASSRCTVTVFCTAENNDVQSMTAVVELGDIAAPTTGWISKSTAPFVGYVLDDVRDFYGDGLPAFPMGDLSSGSFGPMVTVQRDGLTWRERDTSSDVWIPRGVGDANGNGRLEILGHVVGSAVLFEPKSPGGDPFGSIVFGDTLARNNGAGMADVTGDGREEVLMLSDSGCVVVTWRNDRFERLGIALNTSPPAEGNANNRVDEISVGTGDFDGDGRIEIAFSDTDGDLVISEWNGTSFVTEYTYLSEGVGGSGYVSAIDVDGDGRKEVLYGVPDEPNALANGEYGRQVWTYRMFRSTAPNNYELTWMEQFSGVRYGIGYRNGLGGGDLDGKRGDEVVICAYPRLYVFGWEQDTMRPLWFKPDVVSPRFLTYDFDGNGIAELGFGTTMPQLGVMTGFSFSEYAVDTAKLPTPQGLRAVAASSDTVMLSWMPAMGANAYRVFRASDDDPIFRAIDTVATTSLVIVHPQGAMGYRYRLSALPPDGAVKVESDRSAIVDVGLHPSVQPIRVEPDTITNTDLAGGFSLKVYFGGSILQRQLEPTQFALLSSPGQPLAIPTSAVLGSDSMVVIGFRPKVFATISPLQFTLAINELPDAIRVPTTYAELPVVLVPDPETAELILSGLDVVSASRIRLSFSESVNETALSAGAYTITPSGTVASVSRVDERTVELQLGTDELIAPLGITYYVTVGSIQAESGTLMTTGAGNTLAFVLTAETLSDVYVYPHPVRLGTDGSVTFANLTEDAEIQILDQRFNEIARVRESDGNGGVQWDLRDATGTAVPPGMYFYRVNGEGLHKIMIRR